MDPAIETEDLTRWFGDRLALDGVSLRVEPGEVFGFLGPNGAGKSTTIRLLLDLIRPGRGHARILGFDCRRQSHEVRRRVGYLPGDLRLYGRLTARQLASLFLSVRGASDEWPAVEALAKRLELDLDRPAGHCSKGTRQKIGIILALAGSPRVLLLDEPTSGLDPLMQHVVWDILREAAGRGVTVFFSSHVMSEVEQVCERVGILRQGRLVAVEPISRLREKSRRHILVGFLGTPPVLPDFDLPGVRLLRSGPGEWEFEVAGDLTPLVRTLARFQVADIRTEQATLDELLMSYYRQVEP